MRGETITSNCAPGTESSWEGKTMEEIVADLEGMLGVIDTSETDRLIVGMDVAKGLHDWMIEDRYPWWKPEMRQRLPLLTQLLASTL